MDSDLTRQRVRLLEGIEEEYLNRLDEVLLAHYREPVGQSEPLTKTMGRLALQLKPLNETLRAIRSELDSLRSRMRSDA